ncbi:MAG TPA: nucleotidyl transferase AbiEii/AbiGii toxin family protein [Thermoanaerobaculia bacterium]|jgi:hypothetical protein
MPKCADGWYLFGAQAVQVWGLPRLTADVDVTARLRGDNPEVFVSLMRRAGFELRVRDIDDFVKRTRVFPFVHRGSEIPVDVVLAGPGLEDEFLERARRIDLGGVTVPVISAEDLIVTKILAGRPKDIEDVRGILSERLEKLDLRHIRRLLRLLEEAIGQRDLRPLFQKELDSARRKRRR